jgi:hypothetical protein
MPALKPAIFAAASLTVSLAAASAFESVYDISVRARPPETFASPAKSGADSLPTLPLRFVDSGGVGISMAGEWGKDYSHDRRIFREVILEAPPYIDAAAFARIESDWHNYIDRMLAYGNNSIVVPMLLELIDFDQLPEKTGLQFAVYDDASAFRARHAVLRDHFGRLFEWADKRGMKVFLDSDMLALTPPLARVLRTLAPNGKKGGVDASDPRVWDVYRVGLEELFDDLPSIAGLVIRFGEGGSLYNTAGWPYQSEVAVRDAESLRAMLRGLLPVFEARNKVLVLRSWTVGVGRVGRLHTDSDVYDEVLGDIDSPALIVSTKFTSGDFFSYLPLNRTLAQGRHRRLVELQAKPEFEGFGAFPNFLGEEYARALRVLTSANPQIVGTYVLPQFGGPLRAGPRTLYPLKGFWLWTDANVFVASQLAIDPYADVGLLTKRWAEATFGSDRRIVDAVTNVLTDTRKAVLKGFYIRPFAEREVRVPGLEVPPLMWIFEWDMVGGWHSLLSLVYRSSREDVAVAIAEGHEAAAAVRKAREHLQSAIALTDDECRRTCSDALRSLEYQETLFDVLAAWRQASLSYYRWLDTGDNDAWTQWVAGREQFKIASAEHVNRFGRDLDFPAFDLTSANEAVNAAERSVWGRGLAAAVIIGMVALLAIGSPRGQRWRRPRLGAIEDCCRLMWTAAVTPWRLNRTSVDVGASVFVTTVALVLIGFLLVILTAFTTIWIGAGAALVLAIVAVALEGTSVLAGRQMRGHLLVCGVASFIPGVILLFGLIAYAGPLGVWYGFWTSPLFRMAFLTIVLAMPLWTMSMMFAVNAQDSWNGAVGGLLAAGGAAIVALTALLPDWATVLRSLDRPLNFAPATETMLFALRTYAGVSLGISPASWLIGPLLLAAGCLLSMRSRSRPGPGRYRLRPRTAARNS